MNPFVILYATRQGQTRRIAEHIEAAVRDRGHAVHLRDVGEIREPFSLDRYDGAVLAASVHMGKHEHEMVEFVKRHREELDKLTTAFLSVSLTEAGAEDRSRTQDARAKAAADTQRVIDEFLTQTGWRPMRAKAVAGALLYSKYNFILRFIMKRLARKASMPTDTSRDYEYTDWNALDRFVDEVLREAAARATTEGAPAHA